MGDFHSGLEFTLAGMMVRPEFLLRMEQVEPDPKRRGQLRLDRYSKATRLSYFLTNSTPDKELLRAAGAGELDTENGLARQVDRLMASPRFEAAVRAFFEDMLQFEMFEDVAKDPVIYPTYSSIVSADAQEQTLRTIADHLVAKNGDYRDLFTSRDMFLTRALGRIYKLPVAARNGWEAKQLPADSGQSGILTHISFLALHSHPGRSSPTLRGRAIREIFMCQKGMTMGMQANASQPAGAAPARTGAPAQAGASTPPGAAPQAGASTPEAAAQDAQRQFFRSLTSSDRPTPCEAPQTFGPDPNFRTLEGRNIKVFGIDLDGTDSRGNGKPSPGTCPHDDFLGMNGERGIDNQFYRVVGCSNSWQSTGQSNTFEVEMLTGSWGILLNLERSRRYP